MKKKFIPLSSKAYIPLFLILGTPLFSQVGINTTEPQATLHIEAENKNTPTATDGILVPRVSTLPSTAQQEGQLVFLTTTVGQNDSGFYVWTGEAWDKLHEDSIANDVDKSIIVAMGNYTSTTYSDHSESRILILNSLWGNDTSGFSINDNKVTIGKTGSYLVTATSSLNTDSKTNGGHRVTFLYRIKHTSGSTVTYPTSASSSIPNQAVTATNISFSDIIYLKQGDTLEITRQRLQDSGSQEITFLPYGNNTLRLTFLN